MFEAFALNTVGLSYDEGRRHIQLWVHWPRCEATLQRLQDEARRMRKPFVVPGLRRLLVPAGVVGRRGGLTFEMPPPPSHLVYRLPNTVAELRAIVRSLLSKQRVLRARIVVLEGQAAYANDKVRHLRGKIRASAPQDSANAEIHPPTRGLTAGTSRREVAGVFAPRSTQRHTIC